MAEISGRPTIVVPPVKADRDPDAHGQAALLLVESLIHGLIASNTLTVECAIEIVDIAADVKGQLAEELGEKRKIMAVSHKLLNAISCSLRREMQAERHRDNVD